MTTLVIAECGSSHDGSFERAVSLIKTAKACGAAVAKFQYWGDPSKLAARRHAPELASMYARHQLPTTWLPYLKLACQNAGIEFMCSTFLPEDIAVVAPYVDRFKVSSFEVRDQAFLGAHLVFGKPIIASVGMVDAADLQALRMAVRSARQAVPIALLHCVSAYPAPLGELHLSVIRAYGFDGFSDHTAHRWTGALAVAAGAAIIEAHLRAEDTLTGNPDYPHSLSPGHFQEYVHHIRVAELALGTGTKHVQPSEAPMLRYRVGV